MGLIIDAISNNHPQIGNDNIIKAINGRKKGTHAFITEYRRIVWECIIWPLFLEAKRPYFTLQEYHLKRDEFNSTHNIPSWELGYGLSSLVAKGILYKKGGNRYWIHNQLSPFVYGEAVVDYGFAIKHVTYIYRRKRSAKLNTSMGVS